MLIHRTRQLTCHKQGKMAVCSKEGTDSTSCYLSSVAASLTVFLKLHGSHELLELSSAVVSVQLQHNELVEDIKTNKHFVMQMSCVHAGSLSVLYFKHYFTEEITKYNYKLKIVANTE